MKLVAVVALYALFAGSVSWGEAVAALGVVLIVAAYMLALRRLAEREVRLSWRGARALLAGAAQVVPISVTVLRALFRPGKGEMVTVPFDPDGAGHAGRRAASVLALSMAPNGFVAGFDDDGTILLHQLVRERVGGDPVWPV